MSNKIPPKSHHITPVVSHNVTKDLFVYGYIYLRCQASYEFKAKVYF